MWFSVEGGFKAWNCGECNVAIRHFEYGASVVMSHCLGLGETAEARKAKPFLETSRFIRKYAPKSHGDHYIYNLSNADAISLLCLCARLDALFPSQVQLRVAILENVFGLAKRSSKTSSTDEFQAKAFCPSQNLKSFFGDCGGLNSLCSQLSR